MQRGIDIDPERLDIPEQQDSLLAQLREYLGGSLELLAVTADPEASTASSTVIASAGSAMQLTTLQSENQQGALAVEPKHNTAKVRGERS